MTPTALTVIQHLRNGKLRALGVTIFLDTEKKYARVEGVGLHGLKPSKNPIHCGNSGTLMRLLTGLLSAQPFDSVLTGDESLSKRPMLRIAEPLRLMGADIELSKNNTAPINIMGRPLKAIDYALLIPSAQVKSSILLAGLYADGQTIVRERILTRDHTERMLSHTHTHTHTHVPGDISSAAFFIVLATITPGSHLIIRDVGINPCRTGILSILKLMGAKIEIIDQRFFGNEPVADIHISYAQLKGIVIPEEYITAAIDEFPIIFIAAACAHGKTILKNAKELRVKESDRIAVMVENLKKLGVEITEYEDGVTIEGPSLFLGEAALDAKEDHRIAMALSIAAHIALEGISIDNCDFVKTSFPNFVTIANSIGMCIKEK